MDTNDKGGRLGAAMIGAAIGAVAGAAAVALSNKDTREKIHHRVEDLRQKTGNTITGVKKEVKDLETKEREVLATELENMSEEIRQGK
jgi:gas vesicle protein